MQPQTLPQPIMPQAQPALDPSVVNMAKAIRQTESGGNFQATGASGEYGAYQYTAPTWNSDSQKYLGQTVPLQSATPAQQNEVAYKKILDLKNQGYNVGQVASIWNSGKPDWRGNVGTNSSGVAYDTPQYVNSVSQYYQQLKQGNQNPQATPNSSTVGGVQPSQQPQSPSVSGFIGNIFNSGANVIGGLGTAIMHPIQTAENIGGILGGAVEKPFGVNNEDTQKFDNVVNYFKNRYGGDSLGQIMGNIGKTAYSDPVGMALDLSTLLDGVGGAIGAAGKVADISKAADLAKAADFISTAKGLVAGTSPEAAQALRTPGTLSKIAGGLGTAADYTNPLGLGTKAVSGALGMAGNAGAKILGQTTGAGADAIRTVFNASSEGGDTLDAVNAGMKGGQAGLEDLTSKAQQAYDDVAKQTGEDYRGSLSSIQEGAHTLTPEALQPIYDKFDNLLNDFDISRNDKGQLDFTNSPMDTEGDSQKLITQVDNEIQKYKDGEKSVNPENIDNLKKYIDRRYTRSPRGSVFISQIKGSVRDVLNKNVPGYVDMTKEYSQALGDAKDFRDSLGVGSKQSNETILRKITSAAKGNNKYRQALLTQLSEKSGTDLVSQASGIALSKIIPPGLSKYSEILAGAINPKWLLALPFQSPRLVGEFIKVIGKGNGVLEKVADAFIKYKGPEAVKVGTESNKIQQSSISSQPK